MYPFGERLKQARLAKGYLQKEIAEICGVKTSVFGHYEHDRNEPTTKVLRTICETLQVSANWLLGLPERTENPMTFTSKEQAIKDILDYIETNDIKQFKPLMDYCMKSNYDWFKHLCNEDTAKIVIEYIKSRN